MISKVPVFYSRAYVAAATSFETTRKPGWIAASLAERPIEGLTLRRPQPLNESQLARVHSLDYIEAVRTGSPLRLAESQGFDWDEGIWEMGLASNGGVVAAALAALNSGGVAGSLSSGLHHARHDTGAAYCTFNGLALAAFEALDHGAGNVLILDLDAHCGGGTASLVENDPRIWQIDISTNAFDHYEPSARIRLDVVDNASLYLDLLTQRLDECEATGVAFGLCLYNAGMDPISHGHGVHPMTTQILARRETLVFEWCARRKVPVAFVMAGGYCSQGVDRGQIVDLHRLTLAAAVRGLGAENDTPL